MKGPELRKHFPFKSCLLEAFVSLLLVLALLVVMQTTCWSLERPPHNESSNADQIHEDILSGIDLLYNDEFEKAEYLFRSVVEHYPDKPIGYFYLAMVTWSRLTYGFWSSHTADEYKERIDYTIKVAKSRIESGSADHYDFFYLGGALGFKGRFELMEGNWLSSFSLALKAIKALKTSLRMNPDNRDVLLGLGIFDYYTARLSGVIKFLSYLLVHRGDKEEGLRKLHLAAREAVYSATESKSMLLHIYLFLEEEFLKALELADHLAEKYRNNSRYRFLQGVCHVKLGMDREYSDTLAVLRQKSTQAATSSEAAIWWKRALYLESFYDLFHSRYHDARTKLTRILSKPDPVHDPAMIAWPLVKIGMSFDLEGKRGTALDYYQKVLEMENGSGGQFLVKKLLDRPPKDDDPFIGY